MDEPRRGGEQAVVTEERIMGLLEQEDVARAVRQTREELAKLGQLHRDVVNSMGIPVRRSTAP